MKLYHCPIPAFVAALLVVAAPGYVTAEKDFYEISNVPQDVNKVHLPAECPKSGKVTNAMFTFEPSSEDDNVVKVSTFPANLVTAEKEGQGELRLIWNMDVAENTNEGGVRIFFPVNQLKAVSVGSDTMAQILDGFSSVETLSVSSDASLHANLASLNNYTGNKLSLSVSSDAKATVISSIPLDKLSVSSDAKLKLQAPNVEDFSVSSDGEFALKGSADSGKVSSDSKMTVDGNVDYVKITSDAKVTVYGKLTGAVKMSSSAKLYVGEEISTTGHVHASSGAKVYAPSCDNVSTTSGAKCSVNNDVNGEVVADLQVQPFTLTGKHRCGLNPWSWLWIVFVTLVVALPIVWCWSCHQNKKRRNAAATVSYPNAVVVASKMDYTERPQDNIEAIGVEVHSEKQISGDKV